MDTSEANHILIPPGLDALLDEISLNVMNEQPPNILSYSAQYLEKKLVKRDIHNFGKHGHENSERWSTSNQSLESSRFGEAMFGSGNSNSENDEKVQGQGFNVNGEKVQGQTYNENGHKAQGQDFDENDQKTQGQKDTNCRKVHGQTYNENDQKAQGQGSDETDQKLQGQRSHGRVVLKFKTHESEEMSLSHVAGVKVLNAIEKILDDAYDGQHKTQKFGKLHSVERMVEVPEQEAVNTVTAESICDKAPTGSPDHCGENEDSVKNETTSCEVFADLDLHPEDHKVEDESHEVARDHDSQNWISEFESGKDSRFVQTPSPKILQVRNTKDKQRTQGQTQTESKADDKDGSREATTSMRRTELAYLESPAKFEHGDGPGTTPVRRLINLYEDITKFRNTRIILPTPLVYCTRIELKVVPARKIVLTPIPSLDSGFSESSSSSHENPSLEQRVRNWLTTSPPVKTNFTKVKDQIQLPKKSSLVQNWEKLFPPLYRISSEDKFRKSVKFVRSKEILEKHLESAGNRLVMICFYSAAFQTQFEEILFPWLEELGLNYPKVKFLWAKLQLQAWTTPYFWPILLFYKNSERIHEEQVTSLGVMSKDVPNLIGKFSRT